MIHYNSPWGSQTLLHFDCSSVPEALREAQLFGSPDLGAIRGFPGLIERSHLGTLVLTNVHDLSEDIQTKLARVIQEERTYRSGGQKFYPVSIRLIFVEEPKVFADIVKSGKLSLVLLRAFGNNKILLSPLRERREDIPVLTLALIKEFETKHGFGPLDIDKAILSEMSTLPLHENIAELRGRVAEAFQKSDGKTLTRENFFGN
jgi:DNA-binding NtrC family response regulator